MINKDSLEYPDILDALGSYPDVRTVQNSYPDQNGLSLLAYPGPSMRATLSLISLPVRQP